MLACLAACFAKEKGDAVLSVLKQVESLASSTPAGAAVRGRLSQQCYRDAHGRVQVGLSKTSKLHMLFCL